MSDRAAEPMPERAQFRNSRGLRMVADHFAAESDAVVVMANDLRTHKRWRGRYPRISRDLNARGIAALAFDYCGCGESDDDSLRTDKLAEDVRSAVSEARRLGYRRVALWGHGLLAYVCIEAEVADMVTMVLSAPATASMKFDWNVEFAPEEMAALEATGRMTVPSYDAEVRTSQVIEATLLRDIAEVDQAARIGKLRCPVLLINGNNPANVAECARLEGNRRGEHLLPAGSKLHVIDGANHGFAEHLEELSRVGADWLARRMNADKPDAA